MSKVDPAQDYYGALEVNPSAGEDEIRKQYRKLALKYHPDRNPGKEQEFQSRFQQIQAAHECLLDPDQRRKYDLARQRSGAPPFPHSRANPSGQRGNPWKDPSSFPPPPRPPGAPPRRGETATRAPTGTGADRYGHSPNPTPPKKAPENGKSGTQSRADVWGAWQSMNNAQKTQAQRGQQYRVPPAWTGTQTAAESASHPRSAYDTVNGQQRQARPRVPPRANPQMQAASSAEDSAAFRTKERPFGRSNRPSMDDSNSPVGTSPQVPSRSTPIAKRSETGTPDLSHEHDKNDDAPFNEDRRERTPYATGGGERTSFFTDTDTLRRTRSVRDATSLHPGSVVSQGTRDNRHRSLSPHGRTDDNKQSDQSYPPHYAPRKDRPQDEAIRPRSGREFWNDSSSSLDSGDDLHRRRARPSHAASQEAHSYDKPENMRNRAGDAPLPKSNSYAGRKSTQAREDGQNPSHGSPPTKTFDLHSKDDSSSQSESPGENFAKSDQKFSSVGKSSTATDAARLRADDSESVVDFALQPNNSIDSGFQPPLETEGTPQSRRDFRPEGWQQAFTDDRWATQWSHSPGKSVSPTRQAPNSARRVRPVSYRYPSRFPSAAPEVTAEMQERLEEGMPPPPSVADAVDEADAMDLDEPSSAPSQTSVLPDPNAELPTSAAAHAASIRVMNGSDQSSWRLPGDFSRRPSATTSTDQPIASPNSPPSSKPTRPSVGSLSMNSFRHVLPGPSNGEGIRDLNDLGATLPFDSAAANAHPLKAAEVAIAEQIPKPPLAPLPPSTITQHTWATYLTSMNDYICKWQSYNARMVAHFQDCAVALADYTASIENGSSSANGVIHGWLSAVGETSDKRGWQSYVQQLREDVAWRTAWSVACERHADAIEKHGALRSRLLARGC